MVAIYAQPTYPHLAATSDADGKFTISFSVELIRAIAYFFLITMFALAEFLEKYYVAPKLAAGNPDCLDGHIETCGCNEWNRGNSTFGFGFGDGFDVYEENHLEEVFGWSNVCSSWDYTPSREITSIYFVFFEYFMFAYIMLDFANVWASYKRGMVPQWYYKMCLVLTPIMVFFTALFRLIFVIRVYDSMGWHTAGFTAFQFTLLFVSLTNVLYISLTEQSYFGWRGGCLLWTYLVAVLAIDALKIISALIIVFDEVEWKPFGWVISEYVNRAYNLVNIIFPIIISLVRLRCEKPITITLSTPKPTYRS